MKNYILVAVLGTLLVVSNGQPVPDDSKVVQGVFVPTDVYNALQNKANQNQAIQGKSEIQPNSLDNAKLNDLQNQPVLSNSQPILSNSQPILSSSQPSLSNSQPIISNSQPVISNPQPALTNQPTISQPSSSGPVYVLAQQPSQSQPIVLNQPAQNQPLYISQPTPAQSQPIIISQPRTNPPIYVSAQPSATQPMYVSQPGNTVLLQNGQLAQLAPANTQLYTNNPTLIQKPAQNPGTLYAVVQVPSNTIYSG